MSQILEKNKIYLFQAKHNHNPYCNWLKLFLKFSKFHFEQDALNYSYVDIEKNIHPQLTLQESIVLESHTSNILNANVNLRKSLSVYSNPFLAKLVDYVEPLEQKCYNLGITQIIILKLIKSIFSESEFIFANFSGIPHDFPAYEILKKAFKYEVEFNHKTIFIFEEKNEVWLDTAHFFINTANKKYHVSKNLLNTSYNKNKKDTPPLFFNLKAS